jgi:protoporphyrinogen oxidase
MLEPKTRKIVIIRMGPAGLTAAAELAEKRRQVMVLEKDAKYVGGISRTVENKDFLLK